MKIIITGASGFVGRLITSELNKINIKILLVGRSLKKLKKIYPNNKVCEYDELIKFANDYDCLLHLATFNNKKQNDYKKARNENLNIFKQIYKIAKKYKIYIFNFSSIHSLDFFCKTNYAESKREIEKYIKNENYDSIQTLYLPLVYGSKMSGKLKIMNLLPKTISKLILYFLSAFKPTINIDTILLHILKYDFKSKDVNLKNHQLNILSENICKNLFFSFFKRAFDLGFSLFIIIFLWWLFILIWLLIILETPGPGIIFQKRVGKNGKIFNCIKFRTMQIGVKQAPTHQMSSNDITNFGRFLRKTKLDELPQIFNIIFNQMSLIGPRPCLDIQHKLISKREEFNILKIKPGITGYAQINKIDMSNTDIITQFDYVYLKTQSIILDCKIIIKTIFGAGNIDNIQT
ncbi:sugar transferase [Alphaproteobacteria bacterium]|nr:sugar transferase [Alphaproteobacteria bacterium]